MAKRDKIVMFHPYVTESQRNAVNETLKTRWIGQGDKVDLFEEKFGQKFGVPYAVSVNSCTSAIETAIDLIGLKAGDKVITTPLTCTATNLPLVRRGCELIWADIRKDTLNLNSNDVARKALKHGDIKAIMNVHLGGIKSDIKAGSIPIIDDAAQAVGLYRPEASYTCYSFQAIKHFTTGDGGIIVVNNNEEYRKAKLLRWFGIDRELKKANDWQAFREREMLFDIELLGHKRHMNDIAASMGLAALNDYDDIIYKRKKLFDVYRGIDVDGITLLDSDDNLYWLATFLVDDREGLVRKLHNHGIESNVVQGRNDIYNVFGGKRQNLPNMNWAEDKYICLPLHNMMSVEDANYIKDVIEGGW